MFSKLKRILYPENMLFKMIILKLWPAFVSYIASLQLLETIYMRNLLQKDPMQTQWKSRIRC